MSIVKKLTYLVLVLVVGVGMAVAPMGASAAGIFGSNTDLGDLFLLQKLFSNDSLVGGDKMELGDLFILDRLFSPQEEAVAVSPRSVAAEMAGRIVIQVEKNGEAWYVDPDERQRYFLNGPQAAFDEMADQAIGISESDYNTWNADVAPANLSGDFVIRAQANGQVYYVNPGTRTLTHVNGPSGAANLMSNVGVGITNTDIARIPVAEGSLAVK